MDRIFILEGIDGCGKTTTIKELKQIIQFSEYREPGGTLIGEYVRHLIMTDKLDNETRYGLLFTGRKVLYDTIYDDTLKNPLNLNLIDRSFPSSMVYQGIIGGYPIDKIIKDSRMLIDNMLNGILPHIIYLKISKKTALERMKKKKDINMLDEEHMRKLDRIIDAYDTTMDIIEKEKLGKVSTVYIDETMTPNIVAKLVISYLFTQ